MQFERRTSSRQHASRSLSQRIYAFLRPIVLVVILGVARFLTVKGVNYQVCLQPVNAIGCSLDEPNLIDVLVVCGDDTQEHVTEYGVHWNFYFTLAGVYLVYSFLQLFGKAATSPVTAVFIVAGTFPFAPRLVVLRCADILELTRWWCRRVAVMCLN